MWGDLGRSEEMSSTCGLLAHRTPALAIPPCSPHPALRAPPVGTQLFSLLYLLTIFVPLFKNGWWYVFTQVESQLIN